MKNRVLRLSNNELSQAQQRYAKPETIIQMLFEDNIKGEFFDGRFAKMTATYNIETELIKKPNCRIVVIYSGNKRKNLSTDHFPQLVRKYADIQELDAETISEFINKVIAFKAKKVNGRRQQNLQIVYNCIDVIDLM